MIFTPIEQYKRKAHRRTKAGTSVYVRPHICKKPTKRKKKKLKKMTKITKYFWDHK